MARRVWRGVLLVALVSARGEEDQVARIGDERHAAGYVEARVAAAAAWGLVKPAEALAGAVIKELKPLWPGPRRSANPPPSAFGRYQTSRQVVQS